MPTTGLYTHITRAAGTIVTAPLYNTAHFNHWFNDIPNSAGAVADGDLVSFQATQDPAPLGVPNLVASITEEFEQLRFELADIKEALTGAPPAQWYTPITVSPSIVAAKGARVFRNTTQSIPSGVETACIFNTTRYDTGVNGSLTDLFFSGGQPTRLTVPVGGLYQINGFAEWNTGAGGPVELFIRLNGSKILASVEWTSDGSEFPWLPVSTQYELAANDYVELVAFQTVTNPFNIINPEFGIELLNPTAVITPLPHHTLTIIEAGSGTGTVTSSVGAINCPGVCSDSYIAGTVVNLTATPTGGSFVAWAGVPAGHETDNPVAVTMSADETVTATFSLAGQLQGFGPTSSISSTGTFFISPAVKMGDFDTTEANVRATMSAPITLTNLAITLDAALGGLSQLQFRYVVNGVVSNAISLVMIITDGRSKTSAAGSLSLNAGDTLSIQIDATVSAPNKAVQSFTGRYLV